jgi:biopolymer transport protein ExbB/TolQ
MQALAAIFRDGGLFMYFILAAAIIGIAIIIERAMLLTFKCNVDGKALWAKISKLIQDGEIEKARSLCKGSESPLLKVMEAGVTAASRGHKKDIQNIMDEAATEVLPTIDKRIPYLLTLANVATLFGLLGTIHGLIQAFTAVATADPSQKSTLLAGGISIALYNTAFGIGVAVTLLIMYAILQAKANKVIDEIDAVSIKFINLVNRGKGGTQAE